MSFSDRLNLFIHRHASHAVATVDSGYNTAMAVWRGAMIDLDMIHMPKIEYFTVSDAIKQKEDKLMTAWAKFEHALLQHPDIGMVFIEDTALWQESLTSLTSGSTGDLLTLSQVIGGYAMICFSHGIRFKLIPAQQWKGQLNKGAVARRIIREMGEAWQFKNDHITDAVGMGLSMINDWKVTK